MAENEPVDVPISVESGNEIQFMDLASQTKSSGETISPTINLVNVSGKTLCIIGEMHFWSGSTGITNLLPLPHNVLRAFVVRGTLPEGIKMGIALADDEEDSPTKRKFIVAFDTAARKAYAETGPIGPIDWNVVEVKLGLSQSTDEYTDPILKGKAVAMIRTDEDGSVRVLRGEFHISDN